MEPAKQESKLQFVPELPKEKVIESVHAAEANPSEYPPFEAPFYDDDNDPFE
ncbi:hypothetical protein D3C73_1509760 [compost metagenome]